MPSERIQRRIDRLLDQAEEAADARDRPVVVDSVRGVLAIDAENADARGLLTMAEAVLGEGALSGSAAQHVSATAQDPESPRESEPPPAPAVPERPLPDSFVDGRYEVRDFLGEGGRKQVYLAHDTRLNRDVAFAVIKTEGLDANGRQRIQREAEAMGRLSGHPHIVTIYDVGETDVLGETGGQPYIVSEYMAGGDVEALIADAENHQLDLKRAIAIADEVAQALEHAHADGVIHRDIKPGNIWLAAEADGSGTAKLGDFGLAFAASETRMTTEGTMLGTVAYMPPEQGMGQGATAQSDLYALGCTLYEMVTGRPPFLGEDAVAVISQHLNSTPIAPSWHNGQVPSGLDQLITDLLAKAPEARPPDATAVRQRLQSLRTVATPAPVEAVTATQAVGVDKLAWGQFVGRAEDLAELQRRIDDALSGQGSMTMIVGEPGIGKTRLAEEATTYGRLRGAQVLWGRCHESEAGLPYRPWVEALRQFFSSYSTEDLRSHLGSGGADIAKLVSEVRERLPDLPEPGPLGPDEERLRLFESVSTFLLNASQAGPLIVVLDDLHWADRPSLLLLQHLARRLGGQRLAVFGTYRETDLDRRHPLSEVLADLRQERLYERVRLQGVGVEVIVDLLEAVLRQEDRRFPNLAIRQLRIISTPPERRPIPHAPAMRCSSPLPLPRMRPILRGRSANWTMSWNSPRQPRTPSFTSAVATRCAD